MSEDYFFFAFFFAAFFFGAFLAAFFLAAMVVSPVFIELGIVHPLETKHVSNKVPCEHKEKNALDENSQEFFQVLQIFSLISFPVSFCRDGFFRRACARARV